MYWQTDGYLHLTWKICRAQWVDVKRKTEPGTHFAMWEINYEHIFQVLRTK